MKRKVLLGVMAVFILIPSVYWATTLVPGLPPGAYVYDSGRLLALVGFVFLFFQFVLSSRIRWIERGIGLDKMIAIHKTSGKIGLALIFTHPSFLFLSDIMLGSTLILGQKKAIGLVALTLFTVAAGAALLYAGLRLRYETWRTIHLVNYVALPLGLLHSLSIGSDLSGPLGAFWLLLAALYTAVLGYRIWRRIDVRRHPYQVVGVVRETEDTWSLHFKGRRLAHKPGQFMIVRLVREGRVSSPHPFTISSGPASDAPSITAKNVGDFTATISDTTTSDQAYIDAPYGVFSYANHDGPNLVFIAGGIGITPFVSMLRYMRDERVERNVLLIWGNKTEHDIAFRDEMRRMQQEMAGLRVVHVMSAQKDWPGERGYVNAGMLDRYLGDVDDPQIFVCGPPAMMTKVIAALHDLGYARGRIHFERFALR